MYGENTQQRSSVATETRRVKRPLLDEMGLNLGKKTRLWRLLYGAGLRNGTMFLLPLDQGLEHGPRDFFDNPESLDPTFQLRLARDAGFNGVAFQIGLSSKYMGPYAGEVPLIVKLNGKTEIPPDEEALSPVLASVEDAVRLGAYAVGYTLYVGSPAQSEDFHQFNQVRHEAEILGMPLIVWAYPRGRDVEAKGGRDSFWAVDYAARVACELGADVVKVNFPKIDKEKLKLHPKPYNELDIPAEEAMKKVVQSAGKTLVLVSGGTRQDDQDLLDKARASLEAGVTGLIFGRNIWQRKYDDAMSITNSLKQILAEYPS